jgi:hypothetical protein
MRRLILIGTVVALVMAVVLPGSALAGHRPHAGWCAGGSIGSGTWSDFTVTGWCTIEPGAVVRINGNLTITRGARFNDHAAGGAQGAEIHIKGNVRVGRGAVLGLGYNAAEGTLGPDTVGGNIHADRPLTLYLGNLRIGGNVVSIGGGVASTSVSDFRNFPIKDNRIHGNLILIGWKGGWFGVIRNHVHRNVIVSRNVSRSSDTGPGTDEDSTEVQTNVISGNLICFRNVPAAQVNPSDGGVANVVGGKGIGQCAGLTQ